MKKSRNNTIQALRGIACLMVFFSHAIGMIPTSLKIGDTFLHFLYDGKIAVDIFFVLSGYYICKETTELSLNKYPFYLLKKVLRLYPALLLSLVLSMILCNFNLPFVQYYFSEWFSGFWNDRIAVELFIKQMFLRGDFNAINPPLWTMRYEFSMIILLPLLLKGISSLFRKQWIIVLVVFALSVLTVIVMGGIVNSNIIIGVIYKILVTLDFAVLPQFCTGSLIYLCENWILKYYKNQFGVSIFLSIFGMLLMNIENTNALKVSDVILDYIRAIGCGCIIIVCLYGNLLNKISKFHCLVELGNISYEFYIFHFIVLLGMRSVIPYIGNWVLSILLCFTMSCMVGYIIHKYINCRKICENYRNRIWRKGRYE